MEYENTQKILLYKQTVDSAKSLFAFTTLTCAKCQCSMKKLSLTPVKRYIRNNDLVRFSSNGHEKKIDTGR